MMYVAIARGIGSVQVYGIGRTEEEARADGEKGIAELFAYAPEFASEVLSRMTVSPATDWQIDAVREGDVIWPPTGATYRTLGVSPPEKKQSEFDAFVSRCASDCVNGD